MKHVIVTLGDQGAALFRYIKPGQRLQVHYMPAIQSSVANTNGAGDCLVAGACMRLLQGGTPVSALASGLVSFGHFADTKCYTSFAYVTLP